MCEKNIPAMIDTGSELSCIDKSLVDRMGLQDSVSHDTNYTLSGAFGGGTEQPIGEVDLIFKIGRLKYHHTFTVTELANPNILYWVWTSSTITVTICRVRRVKQP